MFTVPSGVVQKCLVFPNEALQNMAQNLSMFFKQSFGKNEKYYLNYFCCHISPDTVFLFSKLVKGKIFWWVWQEVWLTTLPYLDLQYLGSALCHYDIICLKTSAKGDITIII